MRLLVTVLLIGAMVPSGFVAAAEGAKITDPKDKQIVEAFLGHTANVPKTVNAEACRKTTAEECEGLIWTVMPYVEMPLVAYEVTGDAKHLDTFVTAMENLRGAMTKGGDGYLGWYGKPLSSFQNPKDPGKKVDVIINTYRAMELLGRFLTLTEADPALARKYAEQRKTYLDLAENHLAKKWVARGNCVDLGKGGAIFRTHAALKEDKGNLTQPHNKHAIIISGLLSLYRATGKDEYAKLAVELGTRFKRSLTLKDGHYEWNYWDPAGEWDVLPSNPSKWKHWIGVEHKGGYYSASLSQAVLLYEHGLVFDREDMARFVKTQTEKCWNGSMDSPKWARVDGTTSDKYMQGSYMCAALAPLSEKVAAFVYGGRGQEERLAAATHGWQGGPVACGWVDGKFVAMPRSKSSKQPSLDIGKKFLGTAAGKKAAKSLDFEVKGSGYAAPQAPGQMKPMPKALDPKDP
ncbi:MAG: hypothetical protein JXL80_12180 [Planctomycetes bacterium]|nr:hypothetical protein [Planctomycetota bacterium]